MINTTHSSSPYHNIGGPFGDSDASQVDFTILKRNFVNFIDSTDDEENNYEIDSSCRIIVGKKGSGKTLLLKIIQDSCKPLTTELNNSVYYTEIDKLPPDTRLIIKITNWFDEHYLMAEEIWEKIWNRAILRTIYGHVFTKKTFAKFINSQIKISYVERYEKILPTNNVAISIFRQLENILTRYNSSKDLLNFLDLPEWAEFEEELWDLLTDLPPMYFFIDQLDEKYVRSPTHWLKCQIGLFNCVFNFIRSKFGGRLHIVVCLREFVYSYILQTQHGNRYLSEPRIKVLKWDKKMLKYFFNKKIELLDYKYYFIPNKSKTIENFIGFKSIYNKRHNKEEDIYDYIFRHTMLMPRDIINIGNLFSNKLIKLGREADTERILKDSVNEVAKQIANEQLILAAILINTQWIYKGAIENDDLEAYTDPSILNETKENIKLLIKSIDKDRFSNEELLNKKRSLSSYGFSNGDDPFTALYHCGLLGLIEKDSDGKEKVSFFSELRTLEFSLSLTCKKYVFHSCLIDALDIKPTGEPIYV